MFCFLTFWYLNSCTRSGSVISNLVPEVNPQHGVGARAGAQDDSPLSLGRPAAQRTGITRTGRNTRRPSFPASPGARQKRERAAILNHWHLERCIEYPDECNANELSSSPLSSLPTARSISSLTKFHGIVYLHQETRDFGVVPVR